MHVRVVNSYAAASDLVPVNAVSNVDFPTDGNPTLTSLFVLAFYSDSLFFWQSLYSKSQCSQQWEWLAGSSWLQNFSTISQQSHTLFIRSGPSLIVEWLSHMPVSKRWASQTMQSTSISLACSCIGKAKMSHCASWGDYWMWWGTTKIVAGEDKNNIGRSYPAPGLTLRRSRVAAL